jgi:hypothetical protein
MRSRLAVSSRGHQDSIARGLSGDDHDGHAFVVEQALDEPGSEAKDSIRSTSLRQSVRRCQAHLDPHRHPAPGTLGAATRSLRTLLLDTYSFRALR